MSCTLASFLRATAVVLAIGTAQVVHAAEAGPDCPMPDGTLPSDPQLPMTLQAIKAHTPIKIVTIGLASPQVRKVDNTQGIAFKLANVLRHKYPDQDVTIVDKRVVGSTAAEIEKELDQGRGGAAAVDMLKREVLPEHPTLVLWAVGTYSAVNGTDSRELANVVEESLSVLQAAHIDVILIDMQYSPAAAMMVDFQPYLEALQVAASNANAPLFGRFAAMQAWSNDGIFDLDGMAPKQNDDMPTEVDACLGVGLAQMIERAQALHSADTISR